LEVTVLTALGEAMLSSGTLSGALGSAAMTEGEGLSLREAVEWCGRGITVREMLSSGTLSGALGSAAMTEDEGLSLCEAVEWCGRGITVREICHP
jgi:hypothetical protein